MRLSFLPYKGEITYLKTVLAYSFFSCPISLMSVRKDISMPTMNKERTLDVMWQKAMRGTFGTSHVGNQILFEVPLCKLYALLGIKG